MDMDTRMLAGFDREAALSHARGDSELLAVLVQNELKQLHVYRAAMTRALRTGDMARVIAAAHNLEAAAASMRARRLAGVALEVERRARSAIMNGIAEVLAVLDAEIERLQSDILLLN